MGMTKTVHCTPAGERVGLGSRCSVYKAVKVGNCKGRQLWSAGRPQRNNENLTLAYCDDGMSV